MRPRPVAKRVWASLEHEPAEVVAEAMLEAERHQLDLVEAGAAAYGVDVTVVLDIIHVVVRGLPRVVCGRGRNPTVRVFTLNVGRHLATGILRSG